MKYGLEEFRRTLSEEDLGIIIKVAQETGMSAEDVANSVLLMHRAGVRAKRDLSEASRWQPKSMDELTRKWRSR